MNRDILEPLIFFLILSSPSAYSNNLCPISHCPNNTIPIKYPFRLSQGHDQTTPSCSYTNLTCTTQGEVILNLPSFGDFYVRDIRYGNGYPLIVLSDPQNCLPKRFMTSNSSSFKPGNPAHFLYYTFYSCPPIAIAWTKFPTINCLSNSSNVAVATRAVSRQTMTDQHGCREIVTSSMPVGGRSPPDFIGDESVFVLEWDASSCEACPYGETEVVPHSVVYVAYIMIILATVVMPAVICLACCINFITMFRKELKMKRLNANAYAAATTITPPP